MDTTASKDVEARASRIEALERDYLANRRQILENPALSFEKKQLQIKALGDEYFARRREVEEEAA
jgi:lipase chaperone LimK